MVFPEDDWPRCEEFDDVKQLINRIKEMLGKPCHLYPFLGNKLTITKGPNHYLMTPMGPLPLFDLPNPDEVDPAEHGWVGPERQIPAPPTLSEVEDSQHEAEADDEAAQDARDAALEALDAPDADEVEDDAEPDDAPQPPEDGTPMFGN